MDIQEAYRVLSKPVHLTTKEERALAREVLKNVHKGNNHD